MKSILPVNKTLRWIVILELAVPIFLLTIGIYHGLLQVIYRSGLLQSTSFAGLEYYQGLTLHGVINAIVLTTFFAVAFGHMIMANYLKRGVNVVMASISFALMIIGTLMAAWAMLAGKASVLYTFYPPLKAHPAFYLGAALIVVGSWVAFFSWIITYKNWKKEHPNEQTPMAVLGNMINFLIWFICTLPVAYEILGMLVPWSMGITETINIPLARTLFWFFGHALVYFWLLPAYIMFYSMLPKIAGGKLFSDRAGRLVFFLFLIFSVPVGVHHQFSEPSIAQSTKWLQAILTFGVAIPSFITAFTIAASLEYAGKKKGGKGLFGWMLKLPYFKVDKYLFGYLICGLILFIFGGLTGIVNASPNLNSVVHNTAWLPGHFHMTVAGPVFLAILGMSLHIVTKLTGKEVKWKKLNVMVPYLWTIGILMFSAGLMYGGLLGEPRRTNLGLTYLNPESDLFRPDWVISTTLALLGGIMMFISGMSYILVFFRSVFGKKTTEPGIEFPAYEAYHNEPKSFLLDRLTPWAAVMLLIIAIAYYPAFRDVFKYTGPGAPPYNPDDAVPVENFEDTNPFLKDAEPEDE